MSLDDLKQIYNLRWVVETFFELIKVRLGLENFTGKTYESVMQDMHSTIFLCNLEACCTHDLNQELQTQEIPKQINQSVSFKERKSLLRGTTERRTIKHLKYRKKHVF